VIAQLFTLATGAFAPWIQPLDTTATTTTTTTSSSSLTLSPWIISDDDVASQLVSDWLSIIEHLFTAFRGQCLPHVHMYNTTATPV